MYLTPLVPLRWCVGATLRFLAVPRTGVCFCELAAIWPAICGPLESVNVLRGRQKPDGDLREGNKQQTSGPIRAAVVCVAMTTGR